MPPSFATKRWWEKQKDQVGSMVVRCRNDCRLTRDAEGAIDARSGLINMCELD